MLIAPQIGVGIRRLKFILGSEFEMQDMVTADVILRMKIKRGEFKRSSFFLSNKAHRKDVEKFLDETIKICKHTFDKVFIYFKD